MVKSEKAERGGKASAGRAEAVSWRGRFFSRSRSGGARGRAEAAAAGGVVDLGEKGE